MLGALVGLSACGDDAGPTATYSAATPEEAVRRAESAANALMSALMAKLKPALEKGGPSHAVEVCSDVAPRVLDRIRREQRVFLRRTALRVRNPDNAPDAYEERWLRAAQAQPEVRREPHSEVLETDDGGRELRYLRPIYLQPLCSMCHGPRERIQPQILEVIEARYPEDQATGFLPGQLRGVVSVRVPMR